MYSHSGELGRSIHAPEATLPSITELALLSNARPRLAGVGMSKLECLLDRFGDRTGAFPLDRGLLRPASNPKSDQSELSFWENFETRATGGLGMF
jgi:hypothetical protein